MKTLTRLLSALALSLMMCPAAMAQTIADVDNPSGAVWTCSSDHAIIDGYSLDLLRPDGTVLQTLTFIGTSKPTPNASNDCQVAINVQPIAFASGYSARVKAVAGTASSAYTASLNRFNRVPGRPGGPRLLAAMMASMPSA